MKTNKSKNTKLSEAYEKSMHLHDKNCANIDKRSSRKKAIKLKKELKFFNQ